MVDFTRLTVGSLTNVPPVTSNKRMDVDYLNPLSTKINTMRASSTPQLVSVNPVVFSESACNTRGMKIASNGSDGYWAISTIPTFKFIGDPNPILTAHLYTNDLSESQDGQCVF
jgi:hypothetical protein